MCMKHMVPPTRGMSCVKKWDPTIQVAQHWSLIKKEEKKKEERGASTALAFVQLPRVKCPEIDNVIFGDVMITISELVSVCPMERNILVPAYFGVLFQGVLRFLIYIYIYIYSYTT